MYGSRHVRGRVNVKFASALIVRSADIHASEANDEGAAHLPCRAFSCGASRKKTFGVGPSTGNSLSVNSFSTARPFLLWLDWFEPAHYA
jgi:hypothetical protein